MTNVPIDPKILNDEGEIRKLRSDEELTMVNGQLTIVRKKKVTKKKVAKKKPTKAKKKTVKKKTNRKKATKKKAVVQHTPKQIEPAPQPENRNQVERVSNVNNFMAPARRDDAGQSIRGSDSSRNYGRYGGQVRATGENKFVGSAEEKKHKQDTVLFDNKVFQGVENLVDRRDPAVLIDARCGCCGRIYKVPPAIAPVKINGDMQIWKCNDCIKVPAGGVY